MRTATTWSTARFVLSLVLLGTGATGCSSATAEETVASSSEALRAVASRGALSVEYAHPDSIIPAGIAANEDVMFVGSAIDGRVMVLSRVDGRQIAELPQPSDHFALPLVMHMIGPSRVAVLDCGGFPAPGSVDSSPVIYEYSFSFKRGQFRATLELTVRFTGQKIGFAEEFVYLGDGRYLLPDAVYGSIWRVEADGSVTPGIVPKSFEPTDAIPEMVYCPTMPKVTVGGLPFLFTASTIPGVAGIAVRDDTVYFYSSCSAGLYRFPLAALFDEREPWQRAADIRLIAHKPSDVAVEELLEMQFNPFDPSDRRLYVADALQLRLIRIDPSTGEREIVADDPVLFDFPASLGFVPTKSSEPSTLLVLSNQQHRNPMTNDAITEDVTLRPFIVTKVLLKRPHCSDDR